MEFDIISLGDHLPYPGEKMFRETAADRHQLLMEMGVAAERLGFRAFNIGEHHDSEYIVSAPLIILAGIATVTKRIRLGTAVSLVANCDPVRLAEEFNTLDLISRGRAELGVGSGIDKNTFRIFGQDPEMRTAMTEEKLELFKLLLNQAEVNWDGKFRSPLKNMRLLPRSYSEKMIPVNYGTATPDRAASAAKAGYRLVVPTIVAPYSMVKDLGGVYRAAYESSGHDTKSMSVAACAYIYVTEDGVKARQEWSVVGDNYTDMLARDLARHEMNPDISKLISAKRLIDRDGTLVGSPKEVTELILQRYEEAGGFDNLTCLFDCGGLPSKKVMSSLELFGREVIPAVHKRLGTRGR